MGRECWGQEEKGALRLHSCRTVKRGPKQRSLNKVQKVKQKLNEEPSEFLEGSVKPTGNTDTDHEDPGNLKWSHDSHFSEQL